MTSWPVHARITGPIVLIGFGSIGKGTLPLIERHFNYDKKRFVVVDPEDKDRAMAEPAGLRYRVADQCRADAAVAAVCRDRHRAQQQSGLAAGADDVPQPGRADDAFAIDGGQAQSIGRQPAVAQPLRGLAAPFAAECLVE